MANQISNNLNLPNDAYSVIRKRLINDLETDGLDSAGACLYEHMVNRQPAEDTDLSFGHLKLVMARGTQSEIEDRDCLKVINYFTGGRSRLLDVILTFVDPESREPHVLTKEEAKRMLFDGEFYHPYVTDELVENCKEHIMVSYKPSQVTTQVYYLIQSSNG